jgi:bacteriocin biosynthesis cyclodehydratase domain-containing protein
MKDLQKRRPRLALPFTVLAGRDAVHLVAGEDFRYSLTGPGVENWLPGFLAGLDGTRPLAQLTPALAEENRAAALQLAERLYGERVLVDGPAAAAHPARAHNLVVAGSGELKEALAKTPPAEVRAAPDLMVLCQDRLDYDAALRFNRRCLAGPSPWLWASSGPMSRGYVSPPFLPDAGPCLACLLAHFQRLSPAPGLYDELIEHARQGRPVRPVPFPAEALAVLAQLVRWKAGLLSRDDPPAALYRLHVLEVETMEVSAHRVFVDPECPECGGR